MEIARTRTLVVTLDATLIEQLRTALEERGGIVSACPTADGAVDEITNRTYGLAVISAELPDRDGFELTSLLKGLDPLLKIFIVGDDEDGLSIEKAVEAGAEGFMHRPVRVAELLARLQDAMGTTWFAFEEGGAESVGRNADSIVEPHASMFSEADDTGFGLSLHESDGLEALDTRIASAAATGGDSSDDLAPAAPTNVLADGEPNSEGSGDESTQDLPALNIEEFDENNPVSVPVRPDVTAHGIAPVRATVLGPETGTFGTLTPAAAIDERIDQMLGPQGKLTQAINDAVGDALAKALAEQLPGVLAALRGASEK